MRNKIALNAFELRALAGKLSPQAIERVPGATRLMHAAKNYAKHENVTVPNLVTTPPPAGNAFGKALQNVRTQSATDQRAVSPRQDAIHALSTTAKAKELATNPNKSLGIPQKHNVSSVSAMTPEEKTQYDAAGVTVPPLGSTGVMSNPVRDRYLAAEKNGPIVPQPGHMKPFPTAYPSRLPFTADVHATGFQQGAPAIRYVSSPVKIDRARLGLPPGKDSSPLMGDAARDTVVHEGAEEGRHLQSMRLPELIEKHKQRAKARGVRLEPPPEGVEETLKERRQRDAVLGEIERLRKQHGAIPIDSHHDVGVLIDQAESSAGKRLSALQGTTPAEAGARNYADHRVFKQGLPKDATGPTKSETLLRDVMHRVRPSAVGDFPAGGRHEAAAREMFLDEMLKRAPDKDNVMRYVNKEKYHKPLLKGFEWAVRGMPVHPRLEQHYLENFDEYLTRFLNNQTEARALFTEEAPMRKAQRELLKKLDQ